MVAEFDAREYASGWTYQRFLKARLAVLKKLGLKFAGEAAKSAGLLESLVWEAERHLMVHQKQVTTDDLGGRMEKLEKRIVGEYCAGRCCTSLVFITQSTLLASQASSAGVGG